jgi:ABC-2 type transport system permease protein
MVAMTASGALGAALGATIRIDRASGRLRVTPVPTATVVGVDVTVGVLLTLPSLATLALAVARRRPLRAVSG